MPFETDLEIKQKPSKVYTPADWFTQGYVISSNATIQRDNSESTRQTSSYKLNEIENRTFWDERNNKTRIKLRNIELFNWVEALKKLVRLVDNDIQELSLAKDKTESAIAAKNISLDVALENLVTLDGRVQVDYVHDDAPDELRNEIEVIQTTKKNLQGKVAKAFEQLCLLKEARNNVQRDLEDKQVTLGIGVHNENLTKESPGISFKPDPYRVDKGTATKAESAQLSLYNRQRAEAELAASQKLREDIQASLMQAENDIEAQQNATEFAFRRRLQETARAKDELEWQREMTMQEIKAMESEIHELEISIRPKKDALKLAQTRLENRKDHPNVEKAIDEIDYGLMDECKNLAQSVTSIQAKLTECKHQLNSLQSELATINSDLTTKHNAHSILKQCMDARGRLRATPKTPTQLNLTMTGIEKDEHNFLSQNLRLNHKSY